MLFNVNLVSNPGAELGPGALYNNMTVPVPDWTGTGGFTVVKYRTPPCNLPCLPGLPETNDPGPPDRGVNMFAGGSNDYQSTSGIQTLNVSNAAQLIDNNTLQFAMSGWLGGYLDQRDNAQFSAIFEDGGEKFLGSSTVGPVLKTDRVDSNGNYFTGLLYRSTTGVIPSGTREIEFRLDMHGIDGSQNDGYADNLWFSVADPRVAIPEPGSVSTGLLGLALVAAGLRRKDRLKR